MMKRLTRLTFSVVSFVGLFFTGMMMCVVALHFVATFWPRIQPIVDMMP